MPVQCLAPAAARDLDQFNGYRTISNSRDINISSVTQTINANRSQFGDLYTQLSPLQAKVRTAYDDLTGIGNGRSDDNAAQLAAKAKLESLDQALDTQAVMLQTIIAAELSINPNIDKLQTVGYLYGNNDLLDSSSQNTMRNCSANTQTQPDVSTIGDNNTNLSQQSTCARRNPESQNIINKMLGLDRGPIPFKRGIAYTGTERNPIALVAGNYITFQRAGDKWVSTNARSGRSLVVSTDTMGKVLEARGELINNLAPLANLLI